MRPHGINRHERGWLAERTTYNLQRNGTVPGERQQEWRSKSHVALAPCLRNHTSTNTTATSFVIAANHESTQRRNAPCAE
jgi:hypothetical protein